MTIESGYYEVEVREEIGSWETGDECVAKITSTKDWDMNTAPYIVELGITMKRWTGSELQEKLAIKGPGVPECDYGCGNDAHFKNFPQIVNGRLYDGPTCKSCALMEGHVDGDPESVEEALRKMKEIYDKGSLEYRDLQEYIDEGREFETF